MKRVENGGNGGSIAERAGDRFILLDNKTVGDTSAIFEVPQGGACIRAFNVPVGVRILLEMVYSFGGREIVDAVRVNGIELSLTRENNTLQVTLAGTYRVRSENDLGLFGDCAVILCNPSLPNRYSS